MYLLLGVVEVTTSVIYFHMKENVDYLNTKYGMQKSSLVCSKDGFAVNYQTSGNFSIVFALSVSSGDYSIVESDDIKLGVEGSNLVLRSNKIKLSENELPFVYSDRIPSDNVQLDCIDGVMRMFIDGSLRMTNSVIPADIALSIVAKGSCKLKTLRVLNIQGVEAEYNQNRSLFYSPEQTVFSLWDWKKIAKIDLNQRSFSRFQMKINSIKVDSTKFSIEELRQESNDHLLLQGKNPFLSYHPEVDNTFMDIENGVLSCKECSYSDVEINNIPFTDTMEGFGIHTI
jgi:hypothetical protein